jgi:RNA polymerase sigma-70 factor (ECF subfamily)
MTDSDNDRDSRIRAQVPVSPPDPGNGGFDPRAAQLLLLAEQPRILAYIERHLPGSIAALIQPVDVLQDVYIDAFRRIGGFVRHDETSVYRWLVTIARVHIAMLLRRQRAKKRGGGDTVNVSQATDSLVLMLEELAVTRRTPSRSAAGHELMAALERALDRLGGGAAEAIRLRYVDGLTALEAAARMGRTVAAVHMLCQRGLLSIRRDLRSVSQFI